jgi:hypothetical protein
MLELCGVHIPETENEAVQSGWRSLSALVASAPLANCHLERDPRNFREGRLCHATVQENGAAATYCDSNHHCTRGYWRDLPKRGGTTEKPFAST